ncbi:DUF4440 domain-containing protein [Lewinella sp. W8]|uniref:YybH family protein n=1 Tax=Lewinella sp. W8 TaxID=2528208 RepID=UPI00106770D1|nr:DUF4440 domain-containing protein [Lewinella sp. W8]MTB51134.1 DUF4440 domain-containing protein [Lewinella sp. W8]
MKKLYLLPLLLATTLPLVAQTYLGKQKDIDQILENIGKFSASVVAGDYDKIAAAYTEDGKIFPNRRDIIGGRAAVRQYWVLPEGVRTITHKITPVEIKVRGREAYDYGYYEGTTRRANGEEVSWRGKYVIIWRKVGKEWKIYLDIWNSIDG